MKNLELKKLTVTRLSKTEYKLLKGKGGRDGDRSQEIGDPRCGTQSESC